MDVTDMPRGAGGRFLPTGKTPEEKTATEKTPAEKVPTEKTATEKKTKRKTAKRKKKTKSKNLRSKKEKRNGIPACAGMTEGNTGAQAPFFVPEEKVCQAKKKTPKRKSRSKAAKAKAVKAKAKGAQAKGKSKPVSVEKNEDVPSLSSSTSDALASRRPPYAKASGGECASLPKPLGVGRSGTQGQENPTMVSYDPGSRVQFSFVSADASRQQEPKRKLPRDDKREKPKPKPVSVAAKPKPVSAAELRRQVGLVLAALLDATQSGATRIAAAKVLLEQMDKRNNDHEHAKRQSRAERAAAIAEAREILERLADAQCAGDAAPPAVA